MPRVSVPRTAVIAELGEQLRYASKASLVRHVEHIEDLAPQLDPDGLYPEDFVVFRVTGFRPRIDDPRLIPGAALRGDLSALAERLCESAGLTASDLARPTVTLPELMRRWGVTRRTIERYRRLGLIARRIDLGGGRRALAFRLDQVERFESTQRDRLGRAAGFTRMRPDELAWVWSRAVRYRSRLGWSSSRIAHHIAPRCGRSADALRRAIRRIDRQHAGPGGPLFPEPGPPTDRDRLVAIRAVRRGVEPAVIARRAGRRKSAVTRAFHEGRADLLRSLALPAAKPDAGVRPIAVDPVDAPDDLGTLIERMRERRTPDVRTERAHAGVLRALLLDAGARVAALPTASVSGAELDTIETALRCVSRLKAALMLTQLRLVLDTVEERLGGPVDTLSPARACALLLGAIAAGGSGVDRFDPSRGGRLAAPVALAVQRWSRTVPDVATPAEPGRAARRVPAGVPVPDWTRSLDPWQRWLEPDARIVGVFDRLDDTQRSLLADRYGLLGRAPRTLEDIARSSGLHALHLARAERRAIRSALALARESTESV